MFSRWKCEKGSILIEKKKHGMVYIDLKKNIKRMKYWVGVKWEFSRAGAYFFTEMILDGHEPATLVVENKS